MGDLLPIGSLPSDLMDRLVLLVGAIFEMRTTAIIYRQILDNAPISPNRSQSSESSLSDYRNHVETIDITRIQLPTDVLQRYVDDQGPLVEFEILVEILYALTKEMYQPVTYRYATRVVPPFYHGKYKELSCYPSNGELIEKSIVGLWVETQIFGGVVHFDRGKNGRQIRDIYLHPDNHKDNLYKIERQDIISLLERLSSVNKMAITHVQPSGTQITILDAQNQGIYRVKNLADSNLYNILPVALEASGFQLCHGHATEGPNYSVATTTQQKYKGFFMTDGLARQLRARWTEMYGSSSV